MSAVGVVTRAWAPVRRALSELLVLPIRAYQLVLSPLLGPTCRFYPSCSAYAVEAIRVRGPVVGPLLTVRRLARCHPWNPGGLDPVPPCRPRGASRGGASSVVPHPQP